MRRVLFAMVTLAVCGGAMAVPTAGILDRVETWTFLTDGQKATLADAKKALQKGEWKKALLLNEELLAKAPPTIFDAEPKLPVVLIRPAGSDPTLGQKVVAGWSWKFECAQLALLSLDWEGAIMRAGFVRDASPAHRAEAFRVIAQARARQCRYVEAQKAIVEADNADKLGRLEWLVWDQARLQTPEAQLWLNQTAVGPQTGIGQLAGIGESTTTAPMAQRIEACLVLGDWAARNGQDQFAASYYAKALELATKQNLSGLLAVTLYKRYQPVKS